MRLADLPHFFGKPMEGLPTEFRGRFDHTNGVKNGNCWLLDSRESVLGEIGSLNSVNGKATFMVFEGTGGLDLSKIGEGFAWLDRFWEPRTVQRILDMSRTWIQVCFRPSDALITYQDGLASWRKIPSIGIDEEVFEEIVPGKWDHEHCMICNGQIRDSEKAYTDEDNYWLCRQCYWTYGRTGDLQFLVDPL